MAPHLCIKKEQKCENALQILSLAAYASESNKREWNNCFVKFKLQTSGYYNLILVNFILNITKRPDINVTSGKPRENHMACAPFANLVE